MAGYKIFNPAKSGKKYRLWLDIKNYNQPKAAKNVCFGWL